MTEQINHYRLLAGALCVGLNLLAPKPAHALNYADEVHGLSVQPGLFDLYKDNNNGRLLLAIRNFDSPFLMMSSLPNGLGSNDVGLDRGQPSALHLVEFRRVGKRVLLVELNTRFVAHSDNADERASVQQAFAESILWGNDLLAESLEHQVLVDFSSYLLADRHRVINTLNQTEQGAYHVDEKRSALAFENTKSFPDNTEMEAALTFSGPGQGNFVRDVAVDAESLTLRQHVSFLRLPADGFRPRIYHPYSGSYSVSAYDFSTPLSNSLDTHYQVRHRLQKTDPSQALSPVKKPITYYLDRGTPEPVRSALLEGARWWSTAFEKAGFKDAFRVEMMPAGIDPMDIRYNTILWVHRATRGWSYGSYMADPRTGEIIKGAVTLGSQRVRQDILIAESLLAPYGRNDEASRKDMAEQMSLARMRQLAAHEVGHTLGFQHNFAASRLGNGSVMDYPHPMLTLDGDAQISVNNAYGTGLGPWDDYLVKHAYSEFTADQEPAALGAIREQAKAAGLHYVTDADSRAPGDSHPDGLLWDFGPDSLRTFDLLMNARHRALDNFSKAVLPADRQLGELEARLVPVYLLHRYQTEAVARLLGGASYEYGLVADTAAGSRIVDAAVQREALKRLLQTLGAETLALPKNILELMTPPSPDYGRTREYFPTSTAPLFDALAAVESGAAQTTQFMFDTSRLNRLAWQHAADHNQLGLDELFKSVFESTWTKSYTTNNNSSFEVVQLAIDWVVIEATIDALDSGQLHASVAATIRAQLAGWVQWLTTHPGAGVEAQSRAEAAHYLSSYLHDAASVKKHGPFTIPPGAPI